MASTLRGDPINLDLAVAYADDGKVIDGTETVKYTSVRRATGLANMTEEINLASRQNPSWKERAASNAAYVGADLNWSIPSNRLNNLMSGSGERPKPGDYLTDSSDVVWTVIGADSEVLGTTWLLHTLNLAIVYDLRDIISIQRATVTYDATGGPVRTWPPDGGSTPYSSIAANVQKITDEMKEERGLIGFQGAYVVTVDRQVTLTRDDRIVFGSVYLDWTGTIRNPSRVDELPQIDCHTAL